MNLFHIRVFPILRAQNWSTWMFVPYDFIGGSENTNGRRITSWILHLGPLWIIKDRIIYRRSIEGETFKWMKGPIGISNWKLLKWSEKTA